MIDVWQNSENECEICSQSQYTLVIATAENYCRVTVLCLGYYALPREGRVSSFWPETMKHPPHNMNLCNHVSVSSPSHHNQSISFSPSTVRNNLMSQSSDILEDWGRGIYCCTRHRRMKDGKLTVGDLITLRLKNGESALPSFTSRSLKLKDLWTDGKSLLYWITKNKCHNTRKAVISDQTLSMACRKD